MRTVRHGVRPDFKGDLVIALHRWATSLPPGEVNGPVISVSGVEYTPRQILDEIDLDTDFAKEFIAGLSSLHEWMTSAIPESSVIDLIEASVVSPERDASSIQHEIGTMAGYIYNALRLKGELSLAELRKEVGGIQRTFDWAVGWLAKETKIAITLSDGEFRVCLRERGKAANA